jgi:hypothetical protein
MAQTSIPKQTDVNPKIDIQVYNMARVSPTVLNSAEKETARILSEAGIETTWKECPCSQSLGSSNLMLRIIPRLFGSTRADFHDDNLGFAAVGKNGGGILATIFYHRVEAVTKGGDSSKVLGNAIAHEIGHLLLGSNAHTDVGIMRAYWSRDLLKHAKNGLLQFTPEQAELMRAHLFARISQKEVLRRA